MFLFILFLSTFFSQIWGDLKDFAELWSISPAESPTTKPSMLKHVKTFDPTSRAQDFIKPFEVGAAIAGVAARRFRTSVGAKPSWQQSMLRIKDPEKSLDFYRDKMGMRLIDKLDFESMAFSLYFLASVPAEEKTPEPGTSEAHQYLWTFPGTTLELTHNYGSEKEAGAIYHPGNEPQEGNKRDGFGHVAFSVHDVYEFSDELQKSGVKFQKKLDEGRMKGLAFALDPDGYWVELLRGGVKGRNTLAQTMLRVKDPKKSLDFYTKHMGMTLLTHHDYDDFSLYYLGTIPEGATEFPDDRPVLELTHNHGTENDADFQHYNGNEAERKGFGHVGFLVDDVYETCKELEEAGYAMQKAPDAGSMKGLAFARDPDGYWDVVIIFDEADDIIKDGDDEGTQARTVLDFMPKNRVLGFFSATWPRRTHEMARRHLRHDAVMVYATTECESNAAGFCLECRFVVQRFEASPQIETDARKGKRKWLAQTSEEPAVAALSRIKMKAEQLGDEVAKTGTHPGSMPLAWAVLRPSDEPPEARRMRLGLARRTRPEDQHHPIRKLRRQRHPIIREPGPEDPRKIDKGSALLRGLLGDDVCADQVATAVVKAFHGSRHRLMALATALKSNEALRDSIRQAGPQGAAALAQQDPRDWANGELQAKRRRWMQEALREAKVPSGHMAVCPECGGKAFVNTGRAGSGRAARLSKQYAHFKCTEKACGKETHIQEGQEKLKGALKMLQKRLEGNTSTVGVFCNKPETVNKVAKYLEVQLQVRVVPVHELMDHAECTQAQILVATSMLGRGYNFPKMQWLINYDMPDNLLEYMCRVRLASRCDVPGYSLTFLAAHDLLQVRELKVLLEHLGQDNGMPYPTVELVVE
ncbi:Lactoylglutathione lyase (Aldoketomutase) (Glyoxalase I) (Glx I) (Ketone-aldehyde mutase) (Methylglyoxalase) (S-D-lactoylglutathione methylglyoxal lyase) [Durusdinium trenchii]|uniref:Lactoylglutathione lyase n=1 Tax=Durusdinium trenchii TaxID=1381693 RepID=A0ABP0KQT2_9DINO